MFIVRGKYQSLPFEDVDEAETLKEARYLLGEYSMAYGAGWILKIVRRK